MIVNIEFIYVIYDVRKSKQNEIFDYSFFFVCLDYNYDVLEKLGMDKDCSVTVTATVHDAVHKIQDELLDTNEQVGSENKQKNNNL